MSENTHSFVMSGYLNLSDSLPTFAEPVFTGEDGIFYVQDIDPRGRNVRRFLALDSTEEMTPFKGPSISTGDAAIVCFLNSSSLPMVGNSDAVVSQIEKETRSQIPLAVQMQIDDLAKDQRSVLDARNRLQSAISETNRNSAKAFELAFAHSVLWDEILAIRTRDIVEIATHEIISAASVEAADGRLVPSIDQWLSEILGAERVDRIVRNFAFAIKPEKQGELFAYGAIATEPGEFFVTEDFSNIRALPRQEQRLAQILELVIENPAVGFPLLFSHRDSAAFANRALTHVRQHLQPSDDKSEAVSMISRMIPSLYSMSFPMNRGVLLWELAVRLGHHQPIARAITQKMRETNARYVKQVESDVLRILRNKRSDTSPSTAQI